MFLLLRVFWCIMLFVTELLDWYGLFFYRPCANYMYIYSFNIELMVELCHLVKGSCYALRCLLGSSFGFLSCLYLIDLSVYVIWRGYNWKRRFSHLVFICWNTKINLPWDIDRDITVIWRWKKARSCLQNSLYVTARVPLALLMNMLGGGMRLSCRNFDSHHQVGRLIVAPSVASHSQQNLPTNLRTEN